MIVTDALEQLVDSLLCEGYALYPYTPGATKNATPTPFGIVYPPAYAADAAEHLRPPRAALRAAGAAGRGADARRCASWSPSGERHQAAAQRGSSCPARWSARSRGSPRTSRRGSSRGGPAARSSALRLSARRRSTPAATRSTLRRREPNASCAAGSTAPARSRARCSRRTRSLRVAAGASSRRSSARADSVNTFPVLATRRRRRRRSVRRSCCPTIPRSRPESRGGAVRLDRDRGGAAASRAGAERRRARGDRAAGPGGAGDDRARGGRDAGGHRRRCMAASTLRDPRDRRAADASPRACPTRAGRGRRRGRRRDVPARRQGRASGPARTPTCTPGCSTAGPRRSSGSSPTTTADASRRDDRRRPRSGPDARDRPLLYFFAPEVEVIGA